MLNSILIQQVKTGKFFHVQTSNTEWAHFKIQNDKNIHFVLNACFHEHKIQGDSAKSSRRWEEKYNHLHLRKSARKKIFHIELHYFFQIIPKFFHALLLLSQITLITLLPRSFYYEYLQFITGLSLQGHQLSSVPFYLAYTGIMGQVLLLSNSSKTAM